MALIDGGSWNEYYQKRVWDIFGGDSFSCEDLAGRLHKPVQEVKLHLEQMIGERTLFRIGDDNYSLKSYKTLIA